MSKPLYNGGATGAIDDQGRPYITDDGNWSLQGAPPGEGPPFRALLLVINGTAAFGYQPSAQREPYEAATLRPGVFKRADLLQWRGPTLAPGSWCEMILTGGDRYLGWGDTAGEDWMEWGSHDPRDASVKITATTGPIHVPELPEPEPPPPDTEEPPPDTSEPPVPPKLKGTPIGSQHGITAYVDFLRKQPGVPARGPNYDPENRSTWPWPDKIERTLKILANDHDINLA